LVIQGVSVHGTAGQHGMAHFGYLWYPENRVLRVGMGNITPCNTDCTLIAPVLAKDFPGLPVQQGRDRDFLGKALISEIWGLLEKLNRLFNSFSSSLYIHHHLFHLSLIVCN
jgi:hypothetical protein